MNPLFLTQWANYPITNRLFYSLLFILVIFFGFRSDLNGQNCHSLSHYEITEIDTLGGGECNYDMILVIALTGHANNFAMTYQVFDYYGNEVTGINCLPSLKKSGGQDTIQEWVSFTYDCGQEDDFFIEWTTYTSKNCDAGHTCTGGSSGPCAPGEDQFPPEAMCRDLTVTLDQNNIAAITADSINDGSTDDCNIITLSIDQDTFYCSDVGTNTVTLTVMDHSGNTDVCTATVTVVEHTPPTINCPGNDTVSMDANCEFNLGDYTGSATTDDNCDTDVAVTQSPASGTTQSGTTTVTLTATDDAGNTAECTFLVVGEDDTAPTINCPGNDTVLVNSNCEYTMSDYTGLAGADDNCDNNVTVTQSPLPGGSYDMAAVVVLTATDNAGNSSTCSFSVIPEDNTPPTIGCPEHDTVSVDGNCEYSLADYTGQASSGDNCDNSITVIQSPASGTTQSGTTTVTLTATDDAGNTAECTFLVVGEDDTAPTIDCPENDTVSVDENCAYSLSDYTGQASTGDNCDNSVTVTQSPASGTTQSGATTVTLTATDDAGNTSECTFMVIPKDDTSPTTVCKDITVQLDGSGNATIAEDSVDNNSTDNCGIASYATDITSFDCADVGDVTVTLTVTDDSGNTAACTATVTVQDTVSPTAICQDVTVNLDASGNASISPGQVNNGSSDNCVDITLSLDTTDFTSSDLGDNPVTLTAEDANGNSSTCTATVTVQDSDAPTAICQDVTVNLNASGTGSTSVNEVDNGSYDNSGIDTMYLSDSTFNCSETGNQVVTMTVIDDSNNSASCTATVTVVDEIDPTADCKDITVQLDASGIATIAEDSVDNNSTDNCGIASYDTDITSFDCDDVGDDVTVTLTLTDDSNNSSTCTATVTVVDDIAPMALCKNDTLYLDSAGKAELSPIDIDDGSSDNCGIDTMTLDQTEFDTMDLGMNPVALTVFDYSGNSSTCTSTVTVLDTIVHLPPLDSFPPVAMCNDITVFLDINGEVSIKPSDVDGGSFDMESGIDTMMLDRYDFYCSDVGAQTVSLTVMDANDNSASCTATVTVVDNKGPAVLCADITVHLDANGQASIEPADIDGGSTDNCGIASLDLDLTEFDCEDIGDNPVVLTATDVNGNATSCTANVRVKDHYGPELICPGTDTIYADYNCAKPIPNYLDDVTVSDNCGDIYTMYQDPLPGSEMLPPGAYEITITAWDYETNSSSCTISLYVLDVTAPNLSCPEPDTIQGAVCTAPLPDYRDQDLVDDNCQVYVPMTQDPEPGTVMPAGTHDVTLTATDDDGNSAECTFEVTVEAGVPLSIECPADVSLSADGNCEALLGDYTGDGMIEGDCSNTATVSQDPPAGTVLTEGSHTVELTVTDDLGASAACTFTVTVADQTPPVLSCPDDATVTVDGNCIFDLPDYTSGIASDACDVDPEVSQSPAPGTQLSPGEHMLTFTATDAGGNSATCSSTLTIVCEAAQEMLLSGTIKTPWDIGVMDVSVDLSGSSVGTGSTNVNGDYSVIINDGSNITLTPEKDINAAEGVSTLDLVIIQLHILQLEPMTMPEQLIAADASNDGHLSTFDIVQIQDVLLGNVPNYYYNTSWRFVRDGYEFPDPENPWAEAWPEDTTLTDIAESTGGLNFTGIKIGDVDGDYSPNGAQGGGGSGVEERSGTYHLLVPDKELTAGETVDAWIYADLTDQLDGYQATLQFMTEAMEFETLLLDSELDGLTGQNFNTSHVEDGVLHFNYYNAQDYPISSPKRAFGIRFTVPQGVNGYRLSDVLLLNNSRLEPEAYINRVANKLQLEFTESNVQGMVIHPTEPNPFEAEAYVSFELTKDAPVDLRIFDSNGQTHLMETIDGTAGYNTYRLEGSGLPEGVLYLRIASEGKASVQKIVKVH